MVREFPFAPSHTNPTRKTKNFLPDGRGEAHRRSMLQRRLRDLSGTAAISSTNRTWSSPGSACTGLEKANGG